jgi:hypothetical protein
MWFQQGHNVSTLVYEIYFLAAHSKLGNVSRLLTDSVNFSLPAILGWLDAISESNAIFSTILAVIHPRLYNTG